MDYIEMFLLLCLMQSFVLAIALCRLPANRLPNRLLACHVLVWGVMCYFRYTTFQNESYILKHHFVLDLSGIVTQLLFVFVFLYIKYMCLTVNKFRKIDYLHFAPFLLMFILFSKFAFLSPEEKVKMVLSGSGYYNIVSNLSFCLSILQGITYCLLSLRYIKRYHLQVKEHFSNIDHLTLYWLRNIIFLSCITLFLGGIGSFFPNTISSYVFNSLYFIIGGGIYVTSYYLLCNRELFVAERGDTCLDTAVALEFVQSDESPDQEKDENLNAVFQLDETYASSVIEKLTRLMENQRLYLNRDLNLNDVSEKLAIPRHHISMILNKFLNTTFFDYINKYRVNEAKKKIEDPNMDNLTLVAIAFDSGFNSKATFYRNFKKYENITPSEYKQSLQSV